MIKRLTNVYGSVAKRIFETGFKIVGGFWLEVSRSDNK